MARPDRHGYPSSLFIDATRLAQCVAELSVAIATGECTPTLDELRALAVICDANHLPGEAVRIRRWMTGASA
jgi:hypothetical protein